MTRPNLMFVERGFARLSIADEFQPDEIQTCILGVDRYVKIDDRKQYPQLCKGGSRYGNALIYHSDEQLARDCNARLFKTRLGYEKAKAKLLDQLWSA